MVREYRRDLAVMYARRYAMGQNPLFGDFGGIGGNCTNFISQCLYAGSCRMNYLPTFGWYYRSLDDRAPAWTGASVACNRLAAAATDAMTASARFASDLPGAGWETEPWSVGAVALWYAALAAFLLWRRARPR